MPPYAKPPEVGFRVYNTEGFLTGNEKGGDDEVTLTAQHLKLDSNQAQVWNAHNNKLQVERGDTDVPSAQTPVANRPTSNWWLGFFVRLLHVVLRFISAILIIVASSYWMAEANALRNPDNASTPYEDGRAAWITFATAFVLDTVYSFVAFLISLTALWGGRSMSDLCISYYPESGRFADLYRYFVQWLFSLIICIWAYQAAELHHIFRCDRADGSTLGPSSAHQWEYEQATVNFFYYQTRLQTNGTLQRLYLDKHSSGSTCSSTAQLSDSGTYYRTAVAWIFWMFIIRFVISILGLWCFFRADKPYYIFPFTMSGQRRTVRQNLQNKALYYTEAVGSQGIRTNAEAVGFAVGAKVAQAVSANVDVGFDPDEGNSNPTLTVASALAHAASASELTNSAVQISVVPSETTDERKLDAIQQDDLVVPCPAACTCNNVCDRFLYNVFGAFRMHEYVAYLFFILAFAPLYGALGASAGTASYVPSSQSGASMATAPVNYFAESSLKCTFFYSVVPSELANANYSRSIYAPSRSWQIDTSTNAASLSKSTVRMPYLQTCNDLSSSILHFPVATALNPSTPATSFPNQCCSTHADIGPDENWYNSRGEQTNPMRGFAIFNIIGSIFYMISSVAFAVSIAAFNIAPIPQVTLNGMDTIF